MSNGEGPAPQAMRCGAGHIIGMQIGPVTVVKHDRRTYVGVILTAKCKCGADWLHPALRHQVLAALDGLRMAYDVADIEDPQDAEPPPTDK